MSVRRLDPVQPDTFAFTPENLKWAEAAIRNYPAGKQSAAVLPVLWRAQEQNQGWISKPAIEYVANLLGMSYIRVYEVATFYTMFLLSPVGRAGHVQVCGTTPCMLRDAEGLIEVCRRKIHSEPHRVSSDGEFSWEEVECLGACVNAPMVLIGKDTYEDLTPEIFERILDEIALGRTVKPGPQNGRQFTAPEGALTSLTDKALYDGRRTFSRVELEAAPAAPLPKDPPVAAAAEPAKKAEAEAKKVAKPVDAERSTPGEQAQAKAAAGTQETAKQTSPGGRATLKRPPLKKDGK